MKFYLRLFTVLLLAIVIVCDESLSTNVVKKYVLHTKSKMTWHHALHNCTSLGMRLASITSKEENDRLVKQIRDSGVEGDFWIALTNLGGSKLNFYWMSYDIPMNYTNWQPNDPNALASNDNCVELRREFDYRFNDNWCDFPNYFVCEGIKSIAELPGQQSLHDFISLRSSQNN